MSTLSIVDVRKSYGRAPVLSDVSLEVDDGSFVVLVGPSGCGKSSLLRIVAGLDTRHDGKVVINGADVTRFRAKDRDIAMVFQSYALYPHMTVAQNMGFALRLSRTPKDQIQARVAKAAAVLNLSELLSRYPKQLSGGQRQRVAMGRALVRDPKIFLFDEPLSNLDANLRVAMREEIKDLHHRLNATIVYVTHDQIEAMTMADKIVVMNAGRIEQIGAPLELYDNPRNRFVAAFIGAPAMNFLPGVMVAGRSSVAIAGTDVTVRLSGPAPSGGPATIGIRPEHVRLGATDAAGAIAGTLHKITTTGADTYVEVAVGPHRITALTQERMAPPSGASLSLMVESSAVKLFDDTTGSRIQI